MAATANSVGRADAYAFCSMLTLEMLTSAFSRVSVSITSSSQSHRLRTVSQPHSVRLREKVPPRSTVPSSSQSGTKQRKSASPQPRNILHSPLRSKQLYRSPEIKPRNTPSSPSMQLSPGEQLRKSRCLNKIPFERVVDRLVVQLREWGEKEGLDRTGIGEIVEGLEQVKRERKDTGSVVVELSALEERFPPTMQETFDLLKKALTRPPSKGPYDFSVAQARTDIQQTLTALSYKKLLEVGNCYQPSPELVSVSLILFRVLTRLSPSLSTANLTWKTFQATAMQPGPLTAALKSVSHAIDTNVLDIDIIKDLKDQLTKINSRSLEMYDKTGTGSLFLKYLSGLVRVWEARSDQERWRQEAPEFLGAGMPSRKKLLTSLYQRVFQPVVEEEQSSVGGVSGGRTSRMRENSRREEVEMTNRTEDTAMLLHSLSFKREEEHSLPVTRNTSPDKDKSLLLPQTPSIEGVITPATEPQPHLPRRKDKGRPLSADLKQSSVSDMRIYWTLESVFRRFLQTKASTESYDQLLSNRTGVINEFQQSISPFCDGLSAMEVSKRDLLVKSVSEEQRYKEEVRQTFLVLQRQKRVRKGKGMNWMQLEVRRDKAKLVQGMERLAKAKAR